MKRYRVTILYREPTYEALHGARARPYRGSFEVTAPHPDAAVALARRRFREATAQSGVGWVREVVGVEVHALDDAA
jgi:hypothetical protein